MARADYIQSGTLEEMRADGFELGERYILETFRNYPEGNRYYSLGYFADKRDYTDETWRELFAFDSWDEMEFYRKMIQSGDVPYFCETGGE